MRRLLILLNIIMLLLVLFIAFVIHNSSALVWQETELLPTGLRTDMLHLVPGFSGISETTGITYTVNNWGYRDDIIDWTKRHVLFLGDSTTFGLNIEHRNTYAEVWEHLVDDNWQAVNTGVPGRGLRSSYEILQLMLAKGLEPEWVVIGVHSTDPRNDSPEKDELISLGYLGRSINLSRYYGANVLVLYIANESETETDSFFALLSQDYTAGCNTLFINAAWVYREYMDTNGYIAPPNGFYSVPGDMGHPGILSSRLIGEALAEVIP